MPKANKIPYPSVGFANQIKAVLQDSEIGGQSINYSLSGEVTASVLDVRLGTAHTAGNISDFLISAVNQGRDGIDALTMTATLQVNGTEVLSSGITLDGASGEAGVGAVSDAPVFAGTRYAVSRGDRITMNLTLTRTTPVAEMAGLYAAVKIVPVV